MEKFCKECYFWAKFKNQTDKGLCENAINFIHVDDVIKEIPFGILNPGENKARLITYKNFGCTEFEEQEDSEMTENEYKNFMNSCYAEYISTETDDEKRVLFEEKLINVRRLLTYRIRKVNPDVMALYSDVEDLLDYFINDSNSCKAMRRTAIHIEKLMRTVHPLLRDFAAEEKGGES